MSVRLDRASFAAPYERHGRGVFNLCLRITGSRDAAAIATQRAFLRVLNRPHGRERHDRELAASLLAAACHACAASFDHADPDRTAPHAKPIEEANRGLPSSHREVLALRGLFGCSYDELFAVLGADRRTVAERLWRARLELRDRLEGSVLVSIAAVAEPCGRALPLVAMRLDGELRDGEERDRLQAHLRTCGKCRLTQEAMRDADATYRAWPQEQPPPELATLLLTVAEPAA
jgi:DNA-directed RNA polymerase specialized sigma24 family protein